VGVRDEDFLEVLRVLETGRAQAHREAVLFTTRLAPIRPAGG
jgi:hypothetical protein